MYPDCPLLTPLSPQLIRLHAGLVEVGVATLRLSWSNQNNLKKSWNILNYLEKSWKSWNVLKIRAIHKYKRKGKNEKTKSQRKNLIPKICFVKWETNLKELRAIGLQSRWPTCQTMFFFTTKSQKTTFLLLKNTKTQDTWAWAYIATAAASPSAGYFIYVLIIVSYFSFLFHLFYFILFFLLFVILFVV